MPDRVVTQLKALPKPVSIAETAKTILRVAAYARVSTDNKEQETSLAAQTDYYRKKIMEHPDWEFVKIYVDDGISGLSTRRREGFKCMIEDCLAGHIDLVLTKSISRFARNTVDTVTTIRKLKEKGVSVYFEKENIFTTDSKGEFLLTIMSSLAQEESRSISENVTWSYRKRIAEGKVSIAYSTFLGYDKGPEKFTMVVNEEQAIVIRRIYRMFLQGYSSYTIACVLTADNVPAPCGGDIWHSDTVRSILSNEKYKGDALLQKSFTVDYLQKKVKKNEGELPQYYVEGDHEPIISPWLFDYVQKRLDMRLEVNNNHYSGMTLFSSKLICGKCGSIYGPKPWHSTTYNHLVWQCHRRHSQSQKCLAFNVYDKLLHYSVHDIAMKAICKRDIQQIVENAVLQLLPNDRRRKVKRWLRGFRLRDIWKLQSDEDDIALIINKVVVMEDGKAETHLIDGCVMEYAFPDFWPSKHKEKYSGSPNAKMISGRKVPTDVDASDIVTECKNCGEEITQKEKRKLKIFCCDKCRNQWWNTHLDLVNRKAYYEITCQHCGKVITVYGNKNRKYCSSGCFVEHRYGTAQSKR